MTVVAGAGPRARRRNRVLTAVLAALVTAPLVLSGCGSHSASDSAKDDSYGPLPTFLPSASIQADSVLIGTSERPALTTEGDGVDVHLAGGISVRAVVSGPVVPGEGLPYQAPATTCTWTVTLSAASAALPITVSDFTTIDHLGAVYHPTLVAGQPLPPKVLPPGGVAKFELRVVMPTGEGLMRWAPTSSGASHQIVASWDFEVEND
ncbi:hypothetical protein ACSMXN_01510 [Jatrophihabitans sp. DSM 45814]